MFYTRKEEDSIYVGTMPLTPVLESEEEEEEEEEVEETRCRQCLNRWIPSIAIGIAIGFVLSVVALIIYGMWVVVHRDN